MARAPDEGSGKVMFASWLGLFHSIYLPTYHRPYGLLFCIFLARVFFFAIRLCRNEGSLWDARTLTPRNLFVLFIFFLFPHFLSLVVNHHTRARSCHQILLRTVVVAFYCLVISAAVVSSHSSLCRRRRQMRAHTRTGDVGSSLVCAFLCAFSFFRCRRWFSSAVVP